MTEPRWHRLKIWPTEYADVRDHKLTFQVRAWDRDFQVEDYIMFLYFDPLMPWSHDSEDLQRRYPPFPMQITYLATGPWVPQGLCVMGIEPYEQRVTPERVS